MPKALELSGKRFGKLVALKRDGHIGTCVAWLCKCDCGNEVRVRTSSLMNGRTTKCPNCSNNQLIDLTGQRFGRLTVLSFVGTVGHNSFWHCVCDCGNESDVSSHKLRTGHTTSCGCLHKEMLAERSTSHGLSKERLYKVYASMKSRCFNPNEAEYHRYGGRNITVCDEWVNSYEAFHNWAIESGYDENADMYECTLDRIDNDKDYSPDNCRWISIRQQNRTRVEVEMTDLKGATKRFWSMTHAESVTGHDRHDISRACNSGAAMSDGSVWRRCSTLKLLDDPLLYKDGFTVSAERRISAAQEEHEQMALF